MAKSQINEIHFLRFVACISVVMIHAISKVLSHETLHSDISTLYRSIQMLLMYATPMFVLISEFLISHSYQQQIPKGFLIKRVKYILVPYVMMATFYAIFTSYRANWGMGSFSKELLFNYFGEWHGYFIMIIFQFYILHILFVKYFKNIKPIYMVLGSFLISVGYWLILNFHVTHPIMGVKYYSNTLSKVFFLGWLFYFVVAYYAGKNYAKFKQTIVNHQKWIVLGFIGTFAFVQYMYHSGILLKVGSARFDIVAYTVMMFFLLFLIAMKIKQLPNWMVSVSSFSFGIYLLHPFVQIIVGDLQKEIGMHFVLYQAVQFIFGILVPMVMVYFIVKLPFGQFLVGKWTSPQRKKRENSVVLAIE